VGEIEGKDGFGREEKRGKAHLFDSKQIEAVVVGDQIDGQAQVTEASGAADAVQVGFCRLGKDGNGGKKLNDDETKTRHEFLLAPATPSPFLVCLTSFSFILSLLIFVLCT